MSGLDGEALLTSVKRLQAQAAALREALMEAIAILKDMDESPTSRISINAKVLERLDAALATDAGREMLERLRRAEAERDEARTAFEAVSKAMATVAGNPPPEVKW